MSPKQTNTAITPCEAMQIAIRMGVLIALALFLLTGVWGIHTYMRALQQPAEMSFTGTGEYFITNSVAKITFSFSDLQRDVSRARDAVAAQAQDAYTTLEQSNIADTDIQTVGYTIYPEYRYPSFSSLKTPTLPTNTDPKLLGYRVTHTTTATIRDIENIGAILTQLTDLNPETITGPRFIPDTAHEKRAEDIATAEAIQNAKIRAYSITRSSDLRLRKIIRINTHKNKPSPYSRTLEFAAVTLDNTPQTKPIPIHHGEQKVQRTAVITYEIEER